MNEVCKNGNNWIRKVNIILVWLVLWQILSLCIGNSILIVGPVETAAALFAEIGQFSFWKTIFFSLCRILTGFLAGWILGLVLAAASAGNKWLEEFLKPVMTLMKTVPVASFVVLFLIWFRSGMLAAAVSFCIVLPNVYINTLEGIRSTDKKLLEMAQVYRLSFVDRFFYIYRPALKPFWESSMKLTIGMSWKSGVAAEVIGMPDFSVGGRLYLSKVHLDTANVFAWTAVVIVVSILCEKTILHSWKCFLKWQPHCRGVLHMSKRTGKETDGQTDKQTDLQFQTGNEELIMNHLSKAYGDHQLFQDFQGIYRPGEVSYFRTPSGSGKTTLFRMIAGLEVPDSGRIAGNRDVAFAFQENRLCEEYSAMKNVEMITGDKQKACEYLIPLLKETDIRKPCSKLSGGMKRRVEIARAFAADCRVVLLDEPFAGLDEENRRKVEEYIAEYGEEKIVLIATHV